MEICKLDWPLVYKNFLDGLSGIPKVLKKKKNNKKTCSHSKCLKFRLKKSFFFFQQEIRYSLLSWFKYFSFFPCFFFFFFFKGFHFSFFFHKLITYTIYRVKQYLFLFYISLLLIYVARFFILKCCAWEPVNKDEFLIHGSSSSSRHLRRRRRTLWK